MRLFTSSSSRLSASLKDGKVCLLQMVFVLIHALPCHILTDTTAVISRSHLLWRLVGALPPAPVLRLCGPRSPPHLCSLTFSRRCRGSARRLHTHHFQQGTNPTPWLSTGPSASCSFRLTLGICMLRSCLTPVSTLTFCVQRYEGGWVVDWGWCAWQPFVYYSGITFSSSWVILWRSLSSSTGEDRISRLNRPWVPAGGAVHLLCEIWIVWKPLVLCPGPALTALLALLL